MFVDLVVPNGNEAELVGMARRLGFSGLVLLYPPQELKRGVGILEGLAASLEGPEGESAGKRKGFLLHAGVLIEGEAGSRSRRDSGRLTVAIGSESSEHILEKGLADALFGLERTSRRDGLHYRSSGMNHVLCEQAREHRVLIGVSFRDILDSFGKRRARLLGRISQNIRFCTATSCPMTIASLARSPFELRSPRELRSLLMTLGMSPAKASEALASTHASVLRLEDAKRGILRTDDLVYETLAIPLASGQAQEGQEKAMGPTSGRKGAPHVSLRKSPKAR